MTQFKNFGFGILAILCITVVFGSSCGKTQSDKNAQVDSETPNHVAEKTTDGTSAYGTEQPATLPSDQLLTPATQLFAQPPGPAPAGKVWFPEHGHWHDAPASSPGTMFDGQSLQPEAQLTAQPPGPAPAGKVWSPEHGHWHDATSTGSAGQ